MHPSQCLSRNLDNHLISKYQPCQNTAHSKRHQEYKLHWHRSHLQGHEPFDLWIDSAPKEVFLSENALGSFLKGKSECVSGHSCVIYLFDLKTANPVAVFVSVGLQYFFLERWSVCCQQL